MTAHDLLVGLAWIGGGIVALAAEHGVAVSTLQAIIARRTWAHVL